MCCHKLSSPLPGSLTVGTTKEPFLRLLHIEIARFTTNLIAYVTVALIIRLPCVVVSHYAVPCSPDFPLSIKTLSYTLSYPSGYNIAMIFVFSIYISEFPPSPASPVLPPKGELVSGENKIPVRFHSATARHPAPGGESLSNCEKNLYLYEPKPIRGVKRH